jgi:cardiolipin synthase
MRLVPTGTRTLPAHDLLDQAFTRAAGAPLVRGNRIDLLRNAAENYPAWLDAIARAERYIYFESYIIRDDVSGRLFADALTERARAGVCVRLLYDWMGALGKTSRRFWTGLRRGGVEVRCFNPFRIGNPVAWVHRDHRKMLAVDGHVGFVTGLCVGDAWVGDPERGVEPWRDTGVEVRGPAVADIEQAFARVWAEAGPPILHGERVAADDMLVAGDSALRIVAGEPWRTGLMRVDELVAAAAQHTLWVTDAYFAGTPSYVQALRAAALDGVDVRLLVPGGTDIPLLRPISRAGYRPLLEAGVRVFEWKGPMLHAKTAVSDGRWARVGSSNLNVASWIGNFELDVVVEDVEFARAVEGMYLDDLGHATEVVLRAVPRRAALRGLTRAARGRSGRGARDRPGGRARRPAPGQGGSAGRAAAGALRLSNTMGAAITDRRVLTPVEASIVAKLGVALIVLAVLALLWPMLVAVPIAVLVLWLGGALVAKGYVLYRQQRRRHGGTPPSARVAAIDQAERR